MIELIIQSSNGKAAFTVDQDDELSIEFPQDFSDLNNGCARMYLTQADALLLMRFLGQWIDGR